MAKTSVKIVVGDPKNLVRFSYLHLFAPFAFNEGDDPKYSAVLLIPKKSPIVAVVQKAIKEAYEAAVTEKWGGKKPPMEKVTCLFDGDEPKDDGESRGDEYEGHYYLNAKSNNAPGVVDRKCQPILNSEEMYSGAYGLASVGFSGWLNNGKMGISCYLNNVMKVKDGDPLGSANKSAQEDFGNFDFDDEFEDL